MNRNISKIILIGLILLIFTLGALCQNSQVRWYSFNMGYAKSIEAQTVVQSIVGQNIIGTMQQSNTQVISGFFADTLFRNTVVDVKNQEQLPTFYSLWQNYPNPFNPKTIINYSLPLESRVMIKVYDILGRGVVTMVDETQSAGYKSIDWDASNYASGVYFYRINATGVRDAKMKFSQVRKMLLVK